MSCGRFCLGLILVVAAGAELFTGNNLIAMAWASLIGTREVMRNSLFAYVGSVAGCLGTVLLVMWAEIAALGDGAVGGPDLEPRASKAPHEIPSSRLSSSVAAVAREP